MLVVSDTPCPLGPPCLPGAMSEARRDSTSSLQRKKPPWLKLDIPAVGSPVAAAVAAAEEPSFPQGGPGQQGLWVQPAPAPPRDPVAQPLRRQAFLRSVSMPAEPARVPSPHHELRRPGLHRQMSITQTIRRYLAAPAAPWAGGWDGQDRGRRGVSPSGWGWGPDRGPSCLGFRPCHLFPCCPVLLPVTYRRSLLPSSTCPLLSVSPILTLWPRTAGRCASGVSTLCPSWVPLLPAGPSRSACLSLGPCSGTLGRA